MLREMLNAAWLKQDHHHNGDQATRRPRILCSIYVHSFVALAKAVRLFKVWIQSQKMSYQTIDILIIDY